MQLNVRNLGQLNLLTNALKSYTYGKPDYPEADKLMEQLDRAHRQIAQYREKPSKCNCYALGAVGHNQRHPFCEFPHDLLDGDGFDLAEVRAL